MILISILFSLFQSFNELTSILFERVLFPYYLVYFKAGDDKSKEIEATTFPYYLVYFKAINGLNAYLEGRKISILFSLFQSRGVFSVILILFVLERFFFNFV